ncbi:MAG: carboxylating nicotinate-nucleotide diphosphorylase [Acidobacteriaceae bacterium]
MKPSREATEAIIRMALLEDAPWGDLTSQTLIPGSATLTAQLVAREPGVLCGEDLIATAFTLTDPAIRTTFHINDGEALAPRAVVATIKGPARAILQAERIALNFAQRLSGIATLTAAYVAQTAGTKARITDTRKTTPGLRLFERYAVRCGGGHNHRFSLSDAVMAKDNHLALLTTTLPEALRTARATLPHTTHIEVEIDSLTQLPALEPLLGNTIHTIMLDNFSLDDLRTAVLRINGRALTEASGGITLDRIAAIAATGVDIISAGALTHSPRALDLGLDINPV